MTYADLACTPEDKANVHKLITTLANETLSRLQNQQVQLEALGKEIDKLHPLIFLGVIFKDQTLKNCMRKMFKELLRQQFVVPRFKHELSQKMNTQFQQGNLSRFLADFATEVNVPLADLQKHSQRKHWGDFLELLIVS